MSRNIRADLRHADDFYIIIFKRPAKQILDERFLGDIFRILTDAELVIFQKIGANIRNTLL